MRLIPILALPLALAGCAGAASTGATLSAMEPGEARIPGLDAPSPEPAPDVVLATPPTERYHVYATPPDLVERTEDGARYLARAKLVVRGGEPDALPTPRFGVDVLTGAAILPCEIEAVRADAIAPLAPGEAVGYEATARCPLPAEDHAVRGRLQLPSLSGSEDWQTGITPVRVVTPAEGEGDPTSA